MPNTPVERFQVRVGDGIKVRIKWRRVAVVIETVAPTQGDHGLVLNIG
jgi:hypothetical protein